MKKTICAIAALLTVLLTFGGCGGYASHYKAVGFVHSNETESAFMSFYEFEGTMVFKLKNKDGGALEYSAKLGSGEAEISYDCGNGKTSLSPVKQGDEPAGTTDPLPAGIVYIIIETDGKCGNGDFRFEID